jgi:Flp pilus assembly protein TadG
MTTRLRPSVASAHAEEGGQTTVLVALLFVVLLGFAALSLDVGRFYAERRYLQNAVDSASLACARAYGQGGTVHTAWAAADTTLQQFNLKSDPSGTVVSYPGAGDQVNGELTPLDYQNNIVADQNLIGGIKPIADPLGCRVALNVNVPTYFVKLLQPSLATIGMVTRAYASSFGGMLPVVVNRYTDPPGPSSTFIDFTKQEAWQQTHPNQCGADDFGGCPDASFSDLGCTSGCLWGPETVIVGSGYQSSDADFRGFIGLDVRKFDLLNPDGSPQHDYYNNTLGLSSNQLKDVESGYVLAGGYPGPDLVAYDPTANPVQNELQIATMSGSSAGVVVADFNTHYRVGDYIMTQVFDGQVRLIPDFTIGLLSSIPTTSPFGPADGPTFRVGSNQTFRSSGDTVDLTMQRDQFNGIANDTPTRLHDFTFDPDNFVPQSGAGTTVTIKGLQVDSGLAAGIYSVILSGTGFDGSTGSQLATHREFVPLNVGGVVRDFTASLAASSIAVSGGTNAVFTATLNTVSGGGNWGSGPVAVSLDYGTCGAGQVALTRLGGSTQCLTQTITGSPNFVPDKNNPPTVTVTIPIPTSTPTGNYEAILRFRGTNGAGQPVVHAFPLQIAVNTLGGGASSYVNVQGYAVFIITNIQPGTIYGRAVSRVALNPNDPVVAIGRKIRLVPWERP